MSTASKTVSARLPDIVGAAHVATDPAQLSAYAVDGKVPAAVVRPGSKEEVVEIIKYAVAERLAVIPCGARTKLGMGLPPARYDLALDMTRLDRTIAYDPADLTLSVEAGVLLGKLVDTLIEHNQFLPLYIPFFQRATIGGAIASGVDSPLRQFYGTARDYVLGMEFVTGEGVHSKSGGTVVKNVTGYDLHKLMIGSLGTLGVITRVNFKTFPFPAQSHGFLATFESADRAIEMRHRIAKSPLTPLTLEILSPRVAELFLSPASSLAQEAAPPTGVLSPRHWTLASAYVGNEKVIARYEMELRRLAAESGAIGVSILGDDTRPSVWGRLRESFPIMLASSPATTIMKISVLPSRMKNALAAAMNASETNQLPWAAVMRGVGVIYFALLPAERSDAAQRRVSASINQIFAAGATLGANMSVPWVPTEWKGTVKVWGPDRPDFPQMRRVKNVFDPHCVFSPGRFVGGL
jgi:glycolate oxidase FAD binding subunit